MNKLHVSARMKIREGKLEGFKEIREKAKIQAGEKLAAIVKGDSL